MIILVSRRVFRYFSQFFYGTDLFFVFTVFRRLIPTSCSLRSSEHYSWLVVTGKGLDYFCPSDLGMISSQLTEIFFRGVVLPPTRQVSSQENWRLVKRTSRYDPLMMELDQNIVLSFKGISQLEKKVGPKKKQHKTRANKGTFEIYSALTNTYRYILCIYI